MHLILHQLLVCFSFLCCRDLDLASRQKENSPSRHLSSFHHRPNQILNLHFQSYFSPIKTDQGLGDMDTIKDHISVYLGYIGYMGIFYICIFFMVRNVQM